MALIVIAFLLGCIGFNCLPELPHWTHSTGVMLILFLSIFAYCKSPSARNRKISLFLGVMASAFLYTYAWVSWQSTKQIPEQLSGKELTVVGCITSFPQQMGDHWRFNFLIQQFNGNPTLGNVKIQLSWYHTALTPKLGQQWRFQVKLKRPHGMSNPAGFDVIQHWWSQQIMATGYVRGKDPQQSLLTETSNVITKLRQHLLDAMQTVATQTKLSGFIPALTLAERSGIEQSQWQLLRSTGTSHLMAISGLHVGMVALWAFVCIRFIWVSVPFLTQFIAADRIAALAACLLAGFYSLLAGLSLPTMRALIMLCVVMLAVFLKRRIRPGYALAWALLMVLLFDPIAVLSPSFVLSFSAVSLIGFVMTGRVSEQSWWSAWWRLQGAITLGLLPFNLHYFQQVAVYSVLANFFAIPLVTFWILPASLLGCLGLPFKLSSVCWQFSLKGLQLLWWGLSKVALLPHAIWHPASLPLNLQGLLLIALLIALLPRGFPARYLSSFALLPLVFWHSPRPAEASVKLTLLDVGQGLATVIETQKHVLVFDTGARFSSEFNMGSAVVVPYLRSVGYHQIDTLLVSHGDNDHAGGADAILQSLTVNTFYTSVPYRWPTLASTCRAGQHWQWDGVKFRVLYPRHHDLGEGNDSSCVVQISIGQQAILLTGDIEKQAEKRLLSYTHHQLRSTVLIAPHHGSKTSSSWSFLHAVNPQWVLISVGKRNRYHLPNKKILQRYHQLGGKIIQTSEAGAVTLLMDKQGVGKITSNRDLHRHYWQQFYG